MLPSFAPQPGGTFPKIQPFWWDHPSLSHIIITDITIAMTIIFFMIFIFSRAKRIDVISRFIFPLLFAIFNLAYWLYYLLAKVMMMMMMMTMMMMMMMMIFNLAYWLYYLLAKVITDKMTMIMRIMSQMMIIRMIIMRMV